MPWHPRGASPLSTYDRWGHLWCSFCKSRLKSRVLAAPSGIFAIWVMGRRGAALGCSFTFPALAKHLEPSVLTQVSAALREGPFVYVCAM